MPDFRFANRRFARVNTFKEIAHVILTLVEAISVVGQRGREQSKLTGGQRAAVHPNPAVGPFKSHSVALSLRILNCAADGISFGGADVVNDAIWPGKLHLVFT